MSLYFGTAKLTDENVEAAGGDASDWTGYFPPPPAVTVEQAWAVPGVPQQRIPEEKSWWQGLLDKGMTNTFGPGGMVDIFGRRVAPPQPTSLPRSTPGVPVWVYPAVGVVALVAIVALTRRRPSVAGYRRRRRSRR